MMANGTDASINLARRGRPERTEQPYGSAIVASVIPRASQELR
jgi:hypothetical protein